MEIELHANSSSNSSIALRNEEFNRARLKASTGSAVRITDPEKFAKLQAEMKQRQEQQAQLTAAREAERKRREGDDYKTPEERARLAREAKERGDHGASGNGDGDEQPRVVHGDDHKFDPKVDYYAVLGVDAGASAKEIIAAYRKAALSMHPDKYKNESKEQQEAIAAKFVGVSKAFKVLENEEIRLAYDKCRDYMEANPNKGLPTLTPEEQAMVMRGAGELSRLKRMGPKLKKHDDLEKRVEVSLEELHYGCTKAVEVERERVDYRGARFVSEKVFHVVIKRGSREGDVIRFEGEGEETVDTHAGDLVFTLVAVPHGVYRRVGASGLEVFVNIYDGEETKGERDHQIYHVIEVETIGKKQCMLVLRSMYEALCRGGCGGTWSGVVSGQGLYDGPGKPAGDLVVSARYRPFFLEDIWVRRNGRIPSAVRYGDVVVMGSAMDPVGGSLVGGYVMRGVLHRMEAMEMLEECVACRLPRVLVIDVVDDRGDDGYSSGSLRGVSRVLGPCSRMTHVSVCAERGVLDDEIWSTSRPYDVVVLNHAVLRTSESSAERASRMARVRERLVDVMGLVRLHHMRGADIIAIEGAVELLGLDSHRRGRGWNDDEGDSYTPILPQYQLRAGGGINEAGFDDVITSLADTSNTVCVGVLEGSAYVVDVETGEAEMIVAPHREALIKQASWCGPEGIQGVDEADDEFGYLVAYASSGV